MLSELLSILITLILKILRKTKIIAGFNWSLLDIYRSNKQLCIYMLVIGPIILRRLWSIVNLIIECL